MKLTHIELETKNGTVTQDLLELSFRDPSNANPYQVQAIEGLDADDISNRFYGLKGSGANRGYDLRLKKREVVISLGLNPDWETEESYSDLRDRLYRLISSTRDSKIFINFWNGNTEIAILIGTVLKMESSLFEKLPSVKLTIDCRDPLLRARDKVSTTLSGADTDLYYTDSLSTAPHGLKIHATFASNTSDFWFGMDNYTFRVLYPFEAGDVLHLNNDVDFNDQDPHIVDKRVSVSTDSGLVLLSDRIVQGYSTWPLMFPGVNRFNFTYNDEIEIEYSPAYWGV